MKRKSQFSKNLALEDLLKKLNELLAGVQELHTDSYYVELQPGASANQWEFRVVDDRADPVAIALQDGVYDKMISQIEQVKARGGVIIAEDAPRIATIGGISFPGTEAPQMLVSLDLDCVSVSAGSTRSGITTRGGSLQLAT